MDTRDNITWVKKEVLSRVHMNRVVRSVEYAHLVLSHMWNFYTIYMHGHEL